MAFNPAPRSAATPAAGSSTAGGAAAAGAAGGPLLLPSQEVPIKFSLLWEQQVDMGQFFIVYSGKEHREIVLPTYCVHHVCSIFSFPASLPSLRAQQTPPLPRSAGADGSDQLQGHLASDANGDLLLCLLSRAAQRLTALRLPPPGTAAAAPMVAGRIIEVAFTMPALAVAAVEATLRMCSNLGAEQQRLGSQAPPPRDLLVLAPDGRLALHVGKRRLCTVDLPGDPPGAAASGGAAAYAQLLGQGLEGYGGAGGEAGGRVAARLAGNASELSASRPPPSAGDWESCWAANSVSAWPLPCVAARASSSCDACGLTASSPPCRHAQLSCLP